MRKLLTPLFPTLLERTISVGLNPVIQQEESHVQAHVNKQHGFVRLKGFDGDESIFGLVLDKPQYLKNADSELLQDMFKQLKAMSNTFRAHPVEMELRVGSVRRVYEFGNSVPVLEQRA